MLTRLTYSASGFAVTEIQWTFQVHEILPPNRRTATRHETRMPEVDHLLGVAAGSEDYKLILAVICFFTVTRRIIFHGHLIGSLISAAT